MLVFIVVRFGHRLVLKSLNLAVQAIADTHNIAYAVTIYNFTRTFERWIGVAVGRRSSIMD